MNAGSPAALSAAAVRTIAELTFVAAATYSEVKRFAILDRDLS